MSVKVDLTQELKAYEKGELCQRPKVVNGVQTMIPMTVRYTLIACLQSNCKSNSELDPEEKLRQDAFARQLAHRDEVKLTDDRVRLLKKLVNEVFSDSVPITVQILGILDPKGQEKKLKDIEAELAAELDGPDEVEKTAERTDG